MSDTTYANWNHAREITVPLWLLEYEARLRSQPYPDDPSKMALVFECARLNIQSGSGAPLAAAVFDANGLLISVGVDAPGIGGHEMTNALMLASNLWGSKELRQRSDWEMFSLAPPCSVWATFTQRFRVVLFVPSATVTSWPSWIYPTPHFHRAIGARNCMNGASRSKKRWPERKEFGFFRNFETV
ncbi:MAG: hypothetical protein U0Z75_05525 [Deinococcaceae bacterium]